MSDQIDIDVTEEKLTAARTKLILDKPFLGALVLRLPLQEADPAWCATTGTDARKFYYNPEFIAALKPAETQFILAHEALHCALSHFSRREHRIKHRWDLACDYAINPILVAEGLTPPAGAPILREYEGMSAEEIYPCIDDNDMSESLDQHLYDKEDQFSEGGQSTNENPLDTSKGEGDPPPPSDSDDEEKQPPPPDEQQGDSEPEQQEQEKEGAGSSEDTDDNSEENSGSSSMQELDKDEGGASPPPPLQQQEAEELTLQWQQRLAGAAQQAQQAGKMSAVMKRLVEDMLQPQLPWRMLLARFMSSIAKDDYSYTRPSSRRGDPAIYPSLKSTQINAVIGIDVSGSVGNKELSEFVSEINAIKGQVRAKITLLVCDSELIDGSPYIFEPWEELTMPTEVKGGGSTSFRPVFDWANAQDQAPDIMIYFTDAWGEFPAFEPTYPTIWLIKGKQDVPWGQRIQLN